jgi:hypothetical protein
MIPREKTIMARHPVFRCTWVFLNLLLFISLCGFVFGSFWEYSTRQYLKGFSDAIVPAGAEPQQKVEAILAWMANGPSRQTMDHPDELSQRDPRQTLNYHQLLEVCGGATNAFVNLAISNGLSARRLLLLDSHRLTTHVTAEVWLDSRWIVVDPAFHFIARDRTGRLLTRNDLENQETLRQMTAAVPGYLPAYNYSSTVHVRLSRIPIIGAYLRRAFDWVWPRWEESLDWTLLLERSSFALLMTSSLALVLLVLARLLVGKYGEKKLGITRVHLHRQVWRAGAVLWGDPR